MHAGMAYQLSTGGMASQPPGIIMAENAAPGLSVEAAAGFVPAIVGSTRPVDVGFHEPLDGQICAVVAVNIVGFTRQDRDDDIRLYLHGKLYEFLEKAVNGSGIPWAACFCEDRGDGALIVIPPEIPVKGLIGPLLGKLRYLTRRHNHVSVAAAHMRLRAAVHIGPIEHDGHGFIGDDVDLAFRMLESRPLKNLLAKSGAELGLIVSDYVYSSLICRFPVLIDPDAFRTVRFQTKNTRARAWIHLPGEASQDTRCNIDQTMTAFRAALARMDASVRETARIRNLANVTDAQVAAEGPETLSATRRECAT